MKRILIITILITCLLSCSRSIDCTDPSIPFAFISFPQDALDTLVIRKFTESSNFQTLIDTIQVLSSSGSIIKQGDTSHVDLGHPDKYLKPGFDWQIFIPSINRTISISDINKKDKTGNCAAMQTDCFCNDEILSIKVDNQTRVLQTIYSTYYLFIR